MPNKHQCIHISISVLLLISVVLTEEQFPLDDPKNNVLYNINERSPVAYCLIHIEKGKKFEAKEPEPDNFVEKQTNSLDWFKDKRASLKLVKNEEPNVEVLKNKKAGKNLNISSIKIPVQQDGIYKYEQYVKDDNSIFKPEYNTVATDNEGYGVIADCYMANENKVVKRQVRYLYCKKETEKFVIHNRRMTNDGTDKDGKVIWVNSRAGVNISDFSAGGDRFYIGPLSAYADGFMDTEQEDSCTLRIKSSGFLNAVVGVLGFLVVFGF